MEYVFVKDFLLKDTIECGQFFLYEKINDWYYIINGQDIFKVKQEKNKLYYEGISKDYIINFFSLDVNLNEIISTFNDEHLLKSVEKYFGLRLIRQDLWQCIISFVCSSASNIPKIKNNLKLLCEKFGKKVMFDNMEFYLFPEIGKMNNLDLIKECKTGYRAKYIFYINKSVNLKSLNKIKSLKYNKAKKTLMTLPGIGSKVADCICLFSLEHTEACPIDTWVKQVIEKLYLKRPAKNMKEIDDFIQNEFGNNKGLKQQYLFHYIRNLK